MCALKGASVYLSIYGGFYSGLVDEHVVLDFFLDFVRPLIYTTSLRNADIFFAFYSVDLLNDGIKER